MTVFLIVKNRGTISSAINAAIQFLVSVLNDFVCRSGADTFFQIREARRNRAAEEVNWNQIAVLLELAVKFSIQSLKTATFTMCQALVKVCVTAISLMEEQSRNDEASARPSESIVGTTMDISSSEVQTSGPVGVGAAEIIKMFTLSGLIAFAQMCLAFFSSMEGAVAPDAATFEAAERVRSRESGEFEMRAESPQYSTSRTGANSARVRRRPLRTRP